MSDSLGLIIDFIFQEDKINKKAQKLLDNINSKSKFKLNFDVKKFKLKSS